jgi:hypothetical protein
MGAGAKAKRGNPCCGVYSVVIGNDAGVEQRQQKIEHNAMKLRVVTAAK